MGNFTDIQLIFYSIFWKNTSIIIGLSHGLFGGGPPPEKQAEKFMDILFFKPVCLCYNMG